MLVLPRAALQTVGHADVERAVFPTRENIDPVSRPGAHRPGRLIFPESFARHCGELNNVAIHPRDVGVHRAPHPDENLPCYEGMEDEKARFAPEISSWIAASLRSSP